jgi:hypothetical protein
MIHLLLHDLEVAVSVLAMIVCAGVGLLYVAAWIEEAWRRRRHNSRWPYDQYQNEQIIRSIRREAIRDMLEAERDQRYAYDSDVIEGTAVEVRR